MNTANNHFTVENLINKYRNYAIEHCPQSSGFCEDVDEEGRSYFTEYFYLRSPEANIGEQLLAVLYKTIEGDNAQKEIIDALSKYVDVFYTDALSKDELSFLLENYKEVVAYLFAHKDEWCVVHKNVISSTDSKYHSQYITKERERLIKEYAQLKNGATVFIADTNYCDLAVQFPNCIVKGFTGYEDNCKEVWALGQIRMSAVGIKSEIVSGEMTDDDYTYSLPKKNSVDLVILRATTSLHSLRLKKIFGTSCTNLDALYDLLKPSGKMILFSEFMNEMVGDKDDEISKFRRHIAKEGKINTIVSFDEGIRGNSIMLVISKSANETFQIVIEKLSISKEVEAKCIDEDFVWPSYYLSDKPKNGIPLSEIVSYEDLTYKFLCKDIDKLTYRELQKYELPDDIKKTPVVISANMASEYKDANLYYFNMKLAGDPFFEKTKFLLNKIGQPCILLYGNKEKFVVGYVKDLPSEGLATHGSICCLIPKEGIDVRYVAALLLSPEVKNQIVTICEGEVNNTTFPLIMDKVIIPNHSELERLAFLSEENYKALVLSRNELKQEHEHYVKAVRMRKHALTQSLSSIEATLYALNAYRDRQHGAISDDERISRVKQTTVKEAFEYLTKGLKDMLIKLDHLADVEYSFSKPEWIDPEEFIENYIQKNEKGWVNFKSDVTWSKENNKADRDFQNPKTGEIIIKKGTPLNTIMFPKDALKQVLDDIVSNAVSHGFNDETRNDYRLRFSWRTDGIALIISVENNGTPIPSNRDTASLLEYGVSTSLNSSGHHGIGCCEIDGIMRKFDGKVELISSPENEYTVKYILTFNRSNTIKLSELNI